jgi:Arc/MetJ-type ribon-helix-helix transcriptional regulator
MTEVKASLEGENEEYFEELMEKGGYEHKSEAVRDAVVYMASEKYGV